MSEQLFPEAIRLMRARHRLNTFINYQLTDIAKKKILADLEEELRLIELELYKSPSGGYNETGKSDLADEIAKELDKALQRVGIVWPLHQTAAIIRRVTKKNK